MTKEQFLEQRIGEFAKLYYDFEYPLRESIEKFLDEFDADKEDREATEREIRVAFSRFNAAIFDAIESYIKSVTREWED